MDYGYLKLSVESSSVMRNSTSGANLNLSVSPFPIPRALSALYLESVQRGSHLLP